MCRKHETIPQGFARITLANLSSLNAFDQIQPLQRKDQHKLSARIHFIQDLIGLGCLFSPDGNQWFSFALHLFRRRRTSRELNQALLLQLSQHLCLFSRPFCHLDLHRDHQSRRPGHHPS